MWQCRQMSENKVHRHPVLIAWRVYTRWPRNSLRQAPRSITLRIHQRSIAISDKMCYRNMVTLSNWNIFRVTGLLCGEFTGHRWIPRTKASDAELWCFLRSALGINGLVNNREAGYLRRHRAHYDVIVMKIRSLEPASWVLIYLYRLGIWLAYQISKRSEKVKHWSRDFETAVSYD